MKKALFIGTCQLKAIHSLFISNETFSKNFETRVILVFSAKEEEIDEVFADINSYSLIICQPISSSYRNGKFSTKRLVREAQLPKIILIPYIFFNGYFPSITYIDDIEGNRIKKYNIIFHDKNIISHVTEIIDFNKVGDSTHLYQTHNMEYHIERIQNLLSNPNYYSKFSIEKIATESLKELEIRELFPYDYGKPADVKISDFIKDNFRKTLLFHTMNHPTNLLIFETLRRILNILKEEEILDQITCEEISNQKIEEELLGEDKFLIYPSVIKNLGLQFHSEENLNEFVKKYVQLYFKDIKIINIVHNFIK